MVTVGLFLIPLTLLGVRGYSEEVAQQLNRPLASDLARHLEEKKLLRADFAANTKLQAGAKREISQLMVLNPDIEIYVLDARGKILAYSVKTRVGGENSGFEADSTVYGGREFAGSRRRSASHGRGKGKVFSAARINGSGDAHLTATFTSFWAARLIILPPKSSGALTRCAGFCGLWRAR